jgi:hypothetical protein
MRVVAIVFALLLGLAGLLMSVCGGGFLLWGLSAADAQSLSTVLMIAVPSLLFGAGCVWGAIAIYRKSNPDQPPP